MNKSQGSLWRRIVALCKPFWFANDLTTVSWPWPLSKVFSPFQMKAKWVGRVLLGLLLVGTIAVTYLNVKLNYLNGSIFDTLAEFAAAKDAGSAEAAKAAFYAAIYTIGKVFVIGTFVVVLYRWIRAKLGLAWRAWMTRNLLERYFAHRNYYRINSNPTIDNPDERMAQDVDAFVSQTLGLGLTLLDSIVVLFSFSTVLWQISHSLTFIVIGYSLVGSLLILFFGRRLVKLNFDQLKLEADFRYGLIHIRNNVESIAFYRGEKREKETVERRFDNTVYNFNLLTGWTRNVGFLQTAFDYFVVIIPYLVIAPLFFAHHAKIGMFQQAAMAFGQILAALALIVTEFRSLAQYAAIANRLGSFAEALDEPDRTGEPGRPAIETVIAPHIAMEEMTLMTPNYERTLISKLTTEVTSGEGLLVMGRSGVGKSSLLRGLAGLWNSGTGRIIHPDLGEMMFLPQKPYMILGSLREQVLYPNEDATVSDAEILSVLDQVNLPDLAKRVGGLDTVLHWGDVLSLGEQQRLAFARLLMARPKYAILDEATSALDVPNEEHLYGLLKASGTTYVSVGHRPTLTKYHGKVLDLLGDGNWEIRTLTADGPTA